MRETQSSQCCASAGQRIALAADAMASRDSGGVSTMKTVTPAGTICATTGPEVGMDDQRPGAAIAQNVFASSALKCQLIGTA